MATKKVKSAKAWGFVSQKGVIYGEAFKTKNIAEEFASEQGFFDKGYKVVRVAVSKAA